MTQELLAKKAECSTRAIQNYESGARAPNANITIRMAKALNTTVERLFSPMEESDRRDICGAEAVRRDA